MSRGQLRGRLERRVGVGHAVMLFVAAPQTGEDLDRFVDRRLVDGDLLQPPGERAILFDVLELLERRRADDAKIAGREQRLDQRREIHRAAGDRAGADGRVHFVDEENRLRPGAERRDDRLEAFFEVAAEPRARQQRAGVEREDLGILQRALHVVVQQPRGEAFGHRGLADARLADEHRVVLAAAAEHLDRALELLGCGRSADRAGPVAPARSGSRSTRTADRRRGRPARLRAGGRSEGSAAPALASGIFEMPCEMYLSTSSRVTPCSASNCAA